MAAGTHLLDLITHTPSDRLFWGACLIFAGTCFLLHIARAWIALWRAGKVEAEPRYADWELM